MAKQNLLEKAKAVLLTPSKFFDSVKKERSIKESVLFFSVVTIISTILNYVFSPDSYATLVGTLGLPGPVVVIVTVIFSVALSFLMFGFFHLFVMLLGGKQGYKETYKAFAYGSAPTVLGWIPIAGFLFSLWSLYLEVKGISILHKITIWRALGAIALAIVVIVIIAIILSIMLFGSLQGLLTG